MNLQGMTLAGLHRQEGGGRAWGDVCERRGKEAVESKKALPSGSGTGK